ncbi:inactive hydroxysteroid dehydrogenase-like protein 1 [Tiliqua scincoides]|uniref:inactive hydroxysteroid dehydrogenase-like protein 1 n=1 Tax=Tiliqua scincoides TaxID=71010 RepID=UPI0034624260
MAAVDSFSLLLREVGRSCSSYMEMLAFIGALYMAKTCLTFANDTYTLIRLHFIPRLVRKADLVKLYGKWAVVTGCTSGVGKAYAKELASHGVNVILISRNKEKLDAVAREIADTYKVETVVIVADFSKGHGIYPVIEKGLKGKEVGILVNNVGVFYDCPDYFTNLTQDKIWEIININIGATTMMTYMLLPEMVERKKGAIVSIASLACCQPTPHMSAYSASKAYVDHFSRALHYEYGSQGIFVQSLLPSFMSTNMTTYSDKLSQKGILVPSGEEYAHHAIATLGISRRTAGYWPHSIMVLLGQHVPEWLWVWAACRIVTYVFRKPTLKRLP